MADYETPEQTRARLAADALKAAAEEKREDKDRQAGSDKEDKDRTAVAAATKEKQASIERVLILVLAFLGPLMTAAVLYYQSKTYALQVETHNLTNSMSVKLLKTTSDASHAEGVLEGKAGKNANKDNK